MFKARISSALSDGQGSAFAPSDVRYYAAAGAPGAETREFVYRLDDALLRSVDDGGSYAPFVVSGGGHVTVSLYWGNSSDQAKGHTIPATDATGVPLTGLGSPGCYWLPASGYRFLSVVSTSDTDAAFGYALLTS